MERRLRKVFRGVNAGLNQFGRGCTRFGQWTAGRMADHRLLGSLTMAAVILLSLSLIDNRVSLFAVILAVVLGASTWWSWRPGGRARLQYERRLEDERVGYPMGWRPGWYGDPKRQHRVRFWTGTEWTAWVADGADMYREDVV